jgi:hypothetical protein
MGVHIEMRRLWELEEHVLPKLIFTLVSALDCNIPIFNPYFSNV